MNGEMLVVNVGVTRVLSLGAGEGRMGDSFW
jgi:hypothetical protein